MTTTEDYYDLCMTTPTEEKCAQVGEENYLPNARLEIKAYVCQLMRMFGTNPDGTRFKTIRCHHDFGDYLDIRFYYDNQIQEHMKYLEKLECGPSHWDEEAKSELFANGYTKLVRVLAIKSKAA